MATTPSQITVTPDTKTTSPNSAATTQYPGPQITATPDTGPNLLAHVLNFLSGVPVGQAQSAAHVAPTILASRDTTPYPSSAAVYPPQITATRDNPANATPSSAVVHYPGPQITATPDNQAPDGFWGHFLNTVHWMANNLGAIPGAAPQRGAGSTAKVSDKETNPGGGSGAIGSVPDPTLAPPTDPNALALQMFFTNTIAPYLDKLRTSMSGHATDFGNAFADVRKDINPALQPFFNQQRVQAQTGSLADALAASAASGPSFDQLITQIKAAQDAQKQAEYEAMKAQSGQAAGGLLGSLIGASGGDSKGTADFIKQITGQG